MKLKQVAFDRKAYQHNVGLSVSLLATVMALEWPENQFICLEVPVDLATKAQIHQTVLPCPHHTGVSESCPRAQLLSKVIIMLSIWIALSSVHSALHALSDGVPYSTL